MFTLVSDSLRNTIHKESRSIFKYSNLSISFPYPVVICFSQRGSFQRVTERVVKGQGESTELEKGLTVESACYSWRGSEFGSRLPRWQITACNSKARESNTVFDLGRCLHSHACTHTNTHIILKNNKIKPRKRREYSTETSVGWRCWLQCFFCYQLLNICDFDLWLI